MELDCVRTTRSRVLPEFLPILRSPDYYVRPSVGEIAAGESSDEGFSGRVPEFVVGRLGHGEVKFSGLTDVRRIDLEEIVKFERQSVAVYEDEDRKPPIGQGLNKSAEVSLIVDSGGADVDFLVRKLKRVCEKQGAQFVSFDPINSKWTFLVPHFSRFGLFDDDIDDDDDADAVVAHDHDEEEGVPMDASVSPPVVASLSHSLPAHLGLDPVKMQEMRMLMFSGEDEHEDMEVATSHVQKYLCADSPGSKSRTSLTRPSPQSSALKLSSKVSPMKKLPVALLDSEPHIHGNILMGRQKKGFFTKMTKVEGFKLDAKEETPVKGSYGSNIVDAALLMGRSFRVGWGPNGVLVHCGTPVGKSSSGLSSVIRVEKVAFDGVARDEKGKLKEELVDFCFVKPLNLHFSLDHALQHVLSGSSQFRIRRLIADRFGLPEICRAFVEILEAQLEVPSLSVSSRIIVMHQVVVWELIRVLFSERAVVTDDDDMALDKRDTSDVDQVAAHLIRRADFSNWLQESVRHHVQEEVSSLSGSDVLTHLRILLTGRQLDEAVELAASSGDVRLAILLSQAGGSMINRSDLARQLDIWRTNGLDFNFLEKERLKLYELLSGNVQTAFCDSKIDWKRYLGLIMWYHLPPDAPLSFIIHSYEQLVNEGKAPFPVPMYIDERLVDDYMIWNAGDRFDITYYLMLLHATDEGVFSDLKAMFSAFSSTPDPLDYHMIWHYKGVLKAVGTFTSNDLHLLDVSFASQLLSLGLCHWAIYVVLHMPHSEDLPHVQAYLIKEILFRYCETWNKQAVQKQFIADLGVPSAWMDEALAIYYEYHRDMPAALDHFLGCHKWHKAHTIFMTSVAHSLFLSAQHGEIWRLAGVMEDHKAEIPDWDIGAGVYIDYYSIKTLLQENIMDEPDAGLEEKDRTCRNFFNRLKESQAVWGSKISVQARAVYSKMGEELCGLLVSVPAEGATPAAQMSCFETVVGAPTPEDLRSRHLQDAVSVFTLILSQMPA
ncbi:SUPPRESSOR OF AUXIN RESISTANCE 3 isoform X2 [Wolffia australiana]